MRPYIFIGHRFTKEYMESFRKVVKSVVAHYGDTEIIAADLQLVNGHIFKDKIQPLIDQAWFCIFDITDNTKPNVFIELGYAYGKGKYVVLTSKYLPPTDLAGYDVIIYDSFKELQDKLTQYMLQILLTATKHSGKEVAEIPPAFLEVTFDPNEPSKSVLKTEIYGKVQKEQADICIHQLANEGFLNDNGISISYTLQGQKMANIFLKMANNKKSQSQE